MTARRITIGMKPGALAVEASEPAFGAAESDGAAVHPAHTAATIEEFLNGGNAGYEPKAASPSADTWVKRGGETAKPAAALWFGGLSPIVMAGAGAVIGALVAAVAVSVVLPRLTPSLDVRLAPVANRVTAIEARQQQAEVNLGRLNNEIAQAIEADGATATRIEEQAALVAELEKAIAGGIASGPATGGEANLTVFAVVAVAVGQLRAAFYAGRPFEAELVNVYAMAAGEEQLTGSLNELSAPARAGVPSAAELRKQLVSVAAAAGLKLGGPEGYYEYGMSMVNQYIGYSGEPYSVEIANVTVNDADRKLAVGDVAGAIGLVNGLDPAIAVAFQPWLKSANAYVRAEAAVAEMTKSVVDKLRVRMGTDG